MFERSYCLFHVSVLSLLVGLAACGDDDEKSADDTGDDGAPIAGFSDELESWRTHADLVELLHLADYESGALHVDMGTPADSKYIVGGWKENWGSAGIDGEVSYRNVGKRARFYFPLSAKAASKVLLRIKPVGTNSLTPYINNTQIQSVFFKESGFQDVVFDLPAANTVVGENYLLLTFGDAKTVAGEEVAAQVQSIHIGSNPKAQAGLTARRVKISDAEQPAIVLPHGASMSWHLRIPKQSKLLLYAGAGPGSKATGKLAVTIEVDGAGEKALFEQPLKSTWSAVPIELDKYGDQLAKLTFEAHDGAAAVAAPRIIVPPANARKAEKPKNLIVLLIDTLRAERLQIYNPKSRVKSPVLNALAKEGTVFEKAHSTENWTKPSVAAVLTALYPVSHGARSQSAVLSDKALLLSEHLKAQGYATGSFIANGYVSDRFGFDQGWDKYRNFIREEGSTDASNVFKESGDWAEANKDKPFFLYVQTIDPHVPYRPGDEYTKMYDPRNDYSGPVEPNSTGILLEKAKKKEVTLNESDRTRLMALHDGEITKHDVFLGKFVERMKKLGIWENSLFVVVSDHGEEFNEHGSWGHGQSVYEELLHVPFFFRHPGSVPDGQRVAHSVSTMDLAPTALELMGAKPLANAEGRSLVGDIYGDAPPLTGGISFSDFWDERRVLTTANWKFLVRGNLTHSMFDLKNDPWEMKQLTGEEAPVAARFSRIMLGQFLAAKDRKNFTSASQTNDASLEAGEVKMDDDLRKQLEALGYMNPDAPAPGSEG